MRVASSLSETIGDTPLVLLPRLSARIGAEVLAKLEHVNPAGSIKDRAAWGMVEDAERRGLLRPGSTLVEPTSGNTGIALAMLSAVRGYRLVVVMPEAMPSSRIAILRAYGAQVLLTPGALMNAAVEQAEIYAQSVPGAVMLRQFENPANALAHERTTAAEIWRDTGGRLDVFVAGIGTGGTITGVGRFLRRHASSVRIVGVEPSAAAALAGRPVANHAIAGIGAGFVPPLLDRSVVDQVVAVDEDAAFGAARRVAREDGVAAGVSAGAAVAAVVQLASRGELAGARVVVVFPDAGERYVSTGPFRRAIEAG